MAAAYAALTSLMHVVKQVQEYGRHLIFFNQEQIESLGQKVGFLQDFLENHSNIDGKKEAEILENQIADAAYAAEDVIESHVVNQILAGSRIFQKPTSAVRCNVDEVTENLNTVKKRVMDITAENKRFEFPKQDYSMPASSSRSSCTGKITTVGLDEYLLHVMDLLTGGNSARKIISIHGMAGIGKMTLARSVYEKPLIMKHFDIRIWVTISAQYSMHGILSQMVLCLKGNMIGDSSEISRQNENQLGELLYKNLSGRRYLVVLDDMWSIKAWDKVRFFLPDNGNGSRVIVTSRHLKMGVNFGSYYLHMNLLNKDKSWDLFCEITFGQERCPLELEQIGKVIVNKCEGLPLSIVVIAGLLGNSSRAREYWENAAENLNSILTSGSGEYCMKIVSLGYHYLPVHLKPCFLYMALFPEDHEIRVSHLVQLWVAEGFLKPNGSKSWEEVAESYLLDLVDRNLILVCQRGLNGCIKTVRIHGLLRAFCLDIAHQARFLCHSRMSGHTSSQGIENERRIIFHEPKQHSASTSKQNLPKLLQVLKSATLCRSLVGDFDEIGHLSSPTLVRVLSTNAGMFSPKAILRLVNLRYLAFKPQCLSGSVLRSSFVVLPYSCSMLPSTISSLWNVQTIICRGLDKRFVLPSDFWRMSQLRHIVFDEVCLPEPLRNQDKGHDGDVLANLETLSNVVEFRCGEEMVKRIPNIKKLKITYYNISTYYKGVPKRESYKSLAGSYNSLKSLDCLNKLESLNLWFHGSPQQSDLLCKTTFPRSLKKLTLAGTRLGWTDLTMIGSLPNLKVLSLNNDSILGSEWNPIEGEFLGLKVLKMNHLELEHFNADETHFPALESLVLEYMSTLDEIPLNIGNIPTLKSIDLMLCSHAAVTSSKRILEEQEGCGNEDILVRVTFSDRDDLEDFMVKMELESLASDNFQVMVQSSSN